MEQGERRMTKEELEKEVTRLRNENLDIINKYTRFAETDRRTIAELEAEVKEWKDKADLWCKTANLKDHNIMINKELEKENAELKKQQFSLRNERNTFLAQNEQYEKDLIDFNETLTKAKELLKQWLQTSKASSCDNINIVTDTEQFLSEVEK